MIANPPTQSLLPLESVPSDGRTFVNKSVWFVDQDGYRVVFRWHEPLYRFALSDKAHLRLVAVNLRQSELASQEEIARAFGHSVATQRRWSASGLMRVSPTGRSRGVWRSERQRYAGR